MKSSRRPSPYQPLPFHLLRTVLMISSLIVTAILGYFTYHLVVDGFKLPWTFLISLIASFFTILSISLTAIIHGCFFLSPIFNMILNIPLSLVWTAGAGLMIYNMYGTLGHTCSTDNWGSSDGVMICQIYKALFAFIVIGWLAYIGVIVVDIRARMHQNAAGAYRNIESQSELKLESLNRSRSNSTRDIPYGIDNYPSRGVSPPERIAGPYEPRRGSPDRLRMGDFQYAPPPPHQTTYDSARYHDRDELHM